MNDEFPLLETPYAYPFMMLDRLESYDPARRTIVGLKLVPRNEPMLQGHFPGFPIFPGVLLIECLAQASGELMKLEQHLAPMTKILLIESRIKHIKPVYPGDQVRLECQSIGQKEETSLFRVRAIVGEEDVTKGQLGLRTYSRNSAGAIPG